MANARQWQQVTGPSHAGTAAERADGRGCVILRPHAPNPDFRRADQGWSVDLAGLMRSVAGGGSITVNSGRFRCPRVVVTSLTDTRVRIPGSNIGCHRQCVAEGQGKEVLCGTRVTRRLDRDRRASPHERVWKLLSEAFYARRKCAIAYRYAAGVWWFAAPT